MNVIFDFRYNMKTKFLAMVIIGIIVAGTVGVLTYLEQPKTPWDCRMKYGKVKQDIQDCLDGLHIDIIESHHQTFSIRSTNPS